MDAYIRRSEAVPVLRPYCLLADNVSVAAVPEDQRRNFEPVRGELLRQSELVKEAGSVGRERDGRPHLAQFDVQRLRRQRTRENLHVVWPAAPVDRIPDTELGEVWVDDVPAMDG